MVDVTSTGLDHFQSAVVSSSLNQSLVVRSCAGSGKSTTLAARAAALIAQGLDPEALLILTFSVKSKDDLEAKVAALIRSGPRPRVMTHHAHALGVLRKAGVSARVISSSDQRKLVRKLVSDRQAPAEGRQAPAAAVKSVLALISRVKSGLSEPRAGTAEHDMYMAYERGLAAQGAMDFEDMITLAISSLDESAGSSSGPLYRHVMLDEGQDTSEAQFALLQRLAPAGVTSLTAVGDADQARARLRSPIRPPAPSMRCLPLLPTLLRVRTQTIYSFRGSRPDVLQRIRSWWACDELMLPVRCRGPTSDGRTRANGRARSMHESTVVPPLFRADQLPLRR